MRRIAARCLPLLAVAAGLAVTLVAPASADDRQPLDASQVQEFLDDYLPRQLEEHELPGAAVVVVADGAQIALGGYGLADVERGVPVDPERTGMFTASVAKMFTATAAMQLVERGELDLDRDVNDYLTTMSVEDAFPGHPVTMRHLLTHTAGFDYAVLGAGAAEPGGATLGAHLREHVPRRVRPPGEAVSYDNYGVALAGRVIEEITGLDYADYLDEEVFGPLDMNRSSARQPAPDGDVAAGYRVSGDDLVRTRGQYGPLSPTGAGVTATAADMGRFMLAHLADPPHPILREETRAMMQRQQASLDERLPGLGLLWERRRHGALDLVTKDGDMPGFHSNLVLVPAADTGLYVVYDGDGEDNSAWLAGKELERAFVDRFLDAGESAGHDRATSSEEAERHEGEYVGRHVSHSDLLGASGLVGGVTVEAGSDGTVTTSNAMPDDPASAVRTWRPVGDDVYEAENGDLLAFDDQTDDLAMSDAPTYTFHRVPWYESPSLHQAVLASAAGLMLAAPLAGIAASVRRRRAGGTSAALARRPFPLSARTVIGLAVVASLAYTAAFLVMMSDGAAVNEMLFVGDSPLLIVVRVLSTLALVAGAAGVAVVAIGWSRRWSTPLARSLHTVTMTSVVVLLAVCAHHHMLGPGLW